MTIIGDIGCEHDGVPLKGYAALPEPGASPRPMVLVFPGAAGGARRLRLSVDLLAERGYAAAAVSMYDARVDVADHNVAGRLFTELLDAPELLRARTRRWFDAVRVLAGVDPDRVAAIGYCFGGRCVLELARSGASVRATIAYHGLLLTHAPAAAGAIRGPVAAWCAGRDPYAPDEDVAAFRAEMATAGVKHQVTVFSDAQHAFTDPDADGYGLDGIAYDPVAESVSWAGSMALLDTMMRPAV